MVGGTGGLLPCELDVVLPQADSTSKMLPRKHKKIAYGSLALIVVVSSRVPNWGVVQPWQYDVSKGLFVTLRGVVFIAKSLRRVLDAPGHVRDSHDTSFLNSTVVHTTLER